MNLETTHPHKIIVRIFLIFILPIILLRSGLIGYQFRLYLLFFVTIFVGFVVYSERWSFRSLWIRTDNLRKSFIPYFLFTVLCFLGLLLLAFLLHKQPQSLWYTNTHLLFLFIPISIVQEFLYRSFLIRELSQLHLSFWRLILINALLFSLLHIIYNPLHVILPLTFVVGVGFAWMFKKYSNLYLISLSHAVLNFTAVFYTFF